MKSSAPSLRLKNASRRRWVPLQIRMGTLAHVLEHAAQHQAVLVWQDQVENDQVGPQLLDQGSRGGAGGGFADVIAARLEHVGEHEGDRGVVLDQQNRRAAGATDRRSDRRTGSF